MSTASKLVNKIKIIPKWVIFFIDGAILAVSGIAAFFITSNFDLGYLERQEIWHASLIYSFLGLIVMYFTKTYEGIVRYTAMKDGIKLIISTLILGVFIYLANGILTSYLGMREIMPLSVIIISSYTSLGILIIYRLVVKDLLYRFNNSQKDKIVKRIIIFGAGEAGVLTYKTIRKDSQINYIVCGFLDDDPSKKGKYIDGIKVFGSLDKIETIIARNSPTDLIISTFSISQERRKEVIEACIEKQLHVFTIPPVNQWASGVLKSDEIREVNIEDLLGRKSIKLRNEKVNQEMRGSVVLVSGAAGSIGSELAIQIARAKPAKLLLLDKSESALYDIENQLGNLGYKVATEVILADVKERETIFEIFETFRPEYVFHAAAYKHVPMMEKYPKEALKCNVWGTKNMADAALTYNANKFVFVSTDKAVNPTNVMGASKRLAEKYIQSLHQYHDKQLRNSNHTLFITTRFGNVLGSNGSVIPLFKEQIKMGGPVTVTHPDITRYFMTIPEACELVLEAGIMGKGGEIYVFDMGQPVKIYDLAKKMIQLSGKKLNEEIFIEFTGLREGEKMVEELLNNTETVKATHHEKIKIADFSNGYYPEINAGIQDCMADIENCSEWDLVSRIKKLVPEFISNASRFVSLDKEIKEKNFS
ncbi:polysaccharide biosynthesis protein [Lunatibacter salilacus]|uniref:polysaccharide biosynthesis protein n=1 Tax=Lunatibacter salilacus TaxID=2483804 RepID=UPI001F3C1132|nr:nucleoside-diphosphate sugar epimerase/dehydratase [Lunatibacter salilacus]